MVIKFHSVWLINLLFISNYVKSNIGLKKQKSQKIPKIGGVELRMVPLRVGCTIDLRYTFMVLRIYPDRYQIIETAPVIV